MKESGVPKRKEKKNTYHDRFSKYVRVGYYGDLIEMADVEWDVLISAGSKKPYTVTRGTQQRIQIVMADVDRKDGATFYGLTYDNTKIELMVTDRKRAIPNNDGGLAKDEEGNPLYVLSTEVTCKVIDEWPTPKRAVNKKQ